MIKLCIHQYTVTCLPKILFRTMESSYDVNAKSRSLSSEVKSRKYEIEVGKECSWYVKLSSQAVVTVDWGEAKSHKLFTMSDVSRLSSLKINL